MKKIGLLAGLILFLSVASASAYYQNPNLNLGFTNIIDGMLPPPGTYWNNIITWYSSDDFKGENGGKLPLKNEIDVLIECPQLIWIPDFNLPNHFKVGAQGLLPFQNYNVSSDLGLAASHSIVGDLCVGAFVGSTIPIANNFNFHWYFEFDTYVPIGQYDNQYAINPGANFWTFDPFLALTFQMPYGFTFSTRQHVAFNTTNTDYLYDGTTHDLQAGTLYHFNYSFMKTLDFISPELRLGVVGYYAKQLDNDTLNGNDLTGTEEQVLAIGPGIQYMHKGLFFSLKVYFESQAENRPEGQKVVFRTIYRF